MILDNSDDLSIWESILPQFTFPHNHIFLDFITWCHPRYLPIQKAVIVQNNEILLSNTPEAI